MGCLKKNYHGSVCMEAVHAFPLQGYRTKRHTDRLPIAQGVTSQSNTGWDEQVRTWREKNDFSPPLNLILGKERV
jgi:hypothetical protein